MQRDVDVRVVADVLQRPRPPVEAAAQAAVRDAAQLGLVAAVGLRDVQAVLEEEAEDAARDDEQCATRAWLLARGARLLRFLA